MAGNTFGDFFKITTWGESHGEKIGVVIDGCPSGICLSEEEIQKEMNRRRPGHNKFTSNRKEFDLVSIKSGIFQGITTGTPISLIINNNDVDSSKYDEIKDLFRPGHADFTFQKKFGIRDHRGGGRSSGRETATRVAAGVIAKKILKQENLEIFAHTKQIGKIKAHKVNLKDITKNNINCADISVIELMNQEILKARSQGNSIGGIVEVIVKGCPPGLGDPVFDKLDADLAKAIISIGSVKGVEFGKGFESADLTGFENNDSISSEGFITNNAGGILGGISTGQDILIRLAVKPTPSISKEQKTIDVFGNNSKIVVKGRHDPCIVPRIIPVVESMVALVLVEKLMIQRSLKNERN